MQARPALQILTLMAPSKKYRLIASTRLGPLFGLAFDADSRLWFERINPFELMSIEPKTLQLRTHYCDEEDFLFRVRDKLGIIRTLDGQVMTFSTDDPVTSLHLVTRNEAIDAVEIDLTCRSLFCANGSRVHRFHLDGRLISVWDCDVPPLFICHGSLDALWVASSGVLVFDCGTGESSVVVPPADKLRYTDIAVSRQGQVACFGGPIDVFDPLGSLIVQVPGDYSKGCYDAAGRLFAECVNNAAAELVFAADASEVVELSTNTSVELEVLQVAGCSSLAIDATTGRLAASHSGTLFIFEPVS